MIIATALLGLLLAPPQPALALATRGALLIGLGIALVTVGPLRQEGHAALSAFRTVGRGARM